MKPKFTISSKDVIEAQLTLDGKLIADVFTNGFRSIDEVCMNLRSKVSERNKCYGKVTYNIDNITKGLNKTLTKGNSI